jgi:hypothetical protein
MSTMDQLNQTDATRTLAVLEILAQERVHSTMATGGRNANSRQNSVSSP